MSTLSRSGVSPERIDDIMRLTRNQQIVVLDLNFHSEPTECIGYDAKVFQRNVLDADAVAHHGCHADERPHLDHVGQDAVGGAMQMVDTLDGEQVGGDAADACSHAAEHLAELLQVGLAGSVVDGCGALGHNGSHKDVGRARDGGLVEQHIGPSQSPRLGGRSCGRDLVDVMLGHITEVCPQSLESQEMGVEAPPSNLVATGLGNDSLAHACQQRSDHHD